jgi:hypothetical protein
LTFDWTALEAASKCLQQGCGPWLTKFGHPIVLVHSEKSESEIPADRQALYAELLSSGRVHVESIMAGSRAAAFLRQRQANFGDALMIIGGGTGVEHSADLYMARRKPVIPLDLAIGSSRDDGTGGGLRLAKQSRAEPGRFVRFNPAFSQSEGAALAKLATRNGAVAASIIANGLLDLLNKLAPPDAFYVRLMNPAHGQFATVEAFFREVVDPVVKDAGMGRIDMCADKSQHPFINVGIFESLHFSALAIVDVTAERPNCFIELGYALGNANRVLVTAEEGTKLPFDQQAIPCHFWKATDPVSERIAAFVKFWEQHVNRPSLVKIL